MHPNFINITGKSYGYWTIVEDSGKGLVKVKCVCGTEKILKKWSIMCGESKSCGCKKSVNAHELMLKSLEGKRFGRWTVLEFDRRCDNTTYLWRCRCDCGTLKSVHGLILSKGESNSCGCIKKEEPFLRGQGETSFNCLFYNYKRNATKRGVDFVLTIEQFKDITKSICHYCGEPPSQIISKGHSKKHKVLKHAEYKYNGVDRINSNIGYHIDNVVSCCWKCNTAKNDMTLMEFKNKVINIYIYKELKKYDENYFESASKISIKRKDSVGETLCYYRRNARNRNIPFELTTAQFYSLTKECCFYCGVVPSTVTKNYVHNGIDRLKSNLGYTAKNSVPCCKRCNIAKASMGVDEFKKHIENIFNNWANMN